MLKNDIPTGYCAEDGIIVVIDEDGDYAEENRKEVEDGTDHDSGAGDNS